MIWFQLLKVDQVAEVSEEYYLSTVGKLVSACPSSTSHLLMEVEISVTRK